MENKTIGRIVLDYTDYPGQDHYSDGDVENLLLDIARANTPAQIDRIAYTANSWPVMYHFSPLRGNIVDWLPTTGQETVLEIGAGCGAVTGALARKTHSVTCIDLSERRSLINAYRNRECNNVRIRLGNFQTVVSHLEEQFDLVTLIGVLEYGGLYYEGNNPYLAFLQAARACAKPGGRVLLAIENKYGLKYFAGCREDHVKRHFAGLEGYEKGDRVRTFARTELETLIQKAGFARSVFYYPYPDYKFATTIYSDRYLPKVSELKNNQRNFDEDRMRLFDEDKVFDQIVQDGLFPVFSNSFFVECYT